MQLENFHQNLTNIYFLNKTDVSFTLLTNFPLILQSKYNFIPQNKPFENDFKNFGNLATTLIIQGVSNQPCCS